MKIISIIVTVYNIAEYLPRCVDSLLAQTYRQLEIILVDDGSEDGSGEICDHYGAKEERVKVLHQSNQGPSSARNAGFRMAQGEYIGYVDGDDFIEPDMYGAMLGALQEAKAQVAICCYLQVGEGARVYQTTGEIRGLSGREALESYICGEGPYRIYPSVWSKLYTKEVLEGIWFAEGRKSEDIMYTTEVLCKASRCVYLDIPYYHYVVDRRDSIMNQKVGERRFSHEIPAWREQAEYLEKQGLKELSEKAKYYFYRKMLFYYLDFRMAGQTALADRMASMLKKEKEEIKAVYQKSWTALGDRLRIRMMLLSPGMYYRIARWYDQYLIPLRQKG